MTEDDGEEPSTTNAANPGDGISRGGGGGVEYNIFTGD